MKKSHSNKNKRPSGTKIIMFLLQNIMKFKKEVNQIKMGLCPKPRDLTLYRQKHEKRAAQ